MSSSPFPTFLAPPAPPAGEPDLCDPITGQVLDQGDADQLIDAYERAEEHSRTLYHYLLTLRRLIAEKAPEEGPSRTRRVQGQRRRATVCLPADKWDQSKLKEVWHSFPDLAPQYLRIESIGIRAVEFKKLLGTGGPPNVETVKRMIVSANRGPQGLPTVKVEK
jgi:hypothetical protein